MQRNAATGDNNTPIPDASVAHIRLENGHRFDHALDDHLHGVAELAAQFARPFGGQDWARFASLWHDLGKYQPAFQDYIRDRADPDAHIEGAPGRVDHSTVGARLAVDRFGSMGELFAYLIAGHHAGLPDFFVDEDGDATLKSRLFRANEKGLLDFLSHAAIPQELLAITPPQSPPPGDGRDDIAQGLHLWLRMLFSCLTDADFLDTEAFMRPDRPELRRGFPSLPKLLARFNRFMEDKIATAEPSPVNQIRAEVYRHCCEGAAAPPGIFSLTVPTGGGKTLSSLAFALHHAARHDRRRVIYVIPYTSIIEQTADVFRELFGDLGYAVVEHHASAEADPDREDSNSRLACENWDAPLIVTTSVQFFESLFAARSSRCRKLHNIAGSVVILDEAQLIPPELRQPILDGLHRLARDYGVSLVICTATQPELGRVEGLEQRYRGLPLPLELAPDPDQLHQALKRVRVELPDDMNRPVDWPGLARELSGHPSFLCIVNRRQDCRDLHALMPEDSYHLSALMCGQHRADTIAAIKADLRAKRPTRVISTQLVEAGVDLDFPVVFRAMAGLDSIAQAAGRCNREGREDGLGLVKVFIPPSKNFGLIAWAEGAAREMLHGFDGDLLHPDLFRAYFRLLYARIPPDKAGIQRLLEAQGTAMQFRTAAKRFKLIDDWQETVFVQYGEEAPRLLDQLRRLGPERWLMRKLQRYAVSIKATNRNRLRVDGFLEECQPGVFIQALPELYDDRVGLLLEPNHAPAGLIQ